MKKDRQILEQELNNRILSINTNKKIVNRIRTNLLNDYQVDSGKMQRILNKDIELSDLDLDLFCLLCIEIYKATEDELINPENYFEEKEIRIAKRYEGEITERIKLPLDIEDVIMLDSENYLTKMTVKQIVDLWNANIFEYNFQTQRNAKYKKVKDKIVAQPNVNLKSVREIESHLKNNTFLSDTITFNVLADGTDEAVYDARNRVLTIISGEIDILDGFHRIQAMLKAWEKSTDIDLTMQVAIKNYNLRKGQAYVAQINSINKMDKTHLQVLRSDRYSDYIVKELQRESDLKGLVVQTSRISSLNNGLVTYSTLADAIDETFKIETKKEAMELAEKLTSFFDYLIGSYLEEFKNNINEIRKKSLINHNIMFNGYLLLSKFILENDKPLSFVTEFINSINFNRDNSEWEELDILDNGSITSKSKKRVKEYFIRKLQEVK